MQNLKPAAALEIFKLIANLEWQELDANDHAAFADAGPDARLAWIDRDKSSTLAELFDIRPDLDGRTPLMAIIGGDHLQLEIHGIDDEGDPIAISYNLQPSEH